MCETFDAADHRQLVTRGHDLCFLAPSISRDWVWTLVTQEGILAAKVLATNALAFNLSMLRHMMSPQVVGSGEGKRTLFANKYS
jgi:hypothetical protein